LIRRVIDLERCLGEKIRLYFSAFLFNFFHISFLVRRAAREGAKRTNFEKSLQLSVEIGLDPEPILDPDPEPILDPDPEPVLDPDPEPVLDPDAGNRWNRPRTASSKRFTGFSSGFFYQSFFFLLFPLNILSLFRDNPFLPISLSFFLFFFSQISFLFFSR